MLRKCIKLVLFCFLSFLCLSGCTSNNTHDPMTQMRIGFFPNINHSPALIAKDQKFFEKTLGDSVEVTYSDFNSGTAEIEAFFAQALDIGYIGPCPAINGFVKSKGDLIAIAGAANGGSLLVARNGVILQSAADYANKIGGVPNFGNTQDIMLRSYLQKMGLKDATQGGTVTIMQVNNPDIQGLLDKKELDFALVPEPWGTILIDEASAKLIEDEKTLWRNGDYPTSLIIVRKEFAISHPELVVKFLEAHLEAIELINTSPEVAMNAVNNQINVITGKKLSYNIIKESFARIMFTDNLNMNAISDFSETMQQLDFIPKGQSLQDMYDGKYLEDAKN